MKAKIALIAALVTVAGIALSAAPPAYAQGFDITLVPAKVELEVQPGQGAEFSIEIRNNATDAAELSVYPMDYSVNPDNTFIFEEPGYYSYSCATWIEIKEETVSIPAGSVANIPFAVNVPAGAEPGGHFAVIFFQDASTPQPDQGAELTPRIGTQVLLTVPGDIVREGGIVDFTVESDYFSLWAPPADGSAGWPARNTGYHLEVENTGNVHITVSAAINYRSSFGFGSGGVDLGAMTILPGTVRYFEGILPSPPLFGWFKAEAVIMYGPDQFTFDVEKRAETSFTVIPFLWILIIILGVLALWAAIHFARKKLRVSVKLERKPDKGS
ncbi:MAG: hypothetical protein C4536_08600 [Actinobacteria bacterium]|jgi:hypothetical protein|nr:MAG: hypothetical protein C4536_08600 [Actinomycetota bacterium]